MSDRSSGIHPPRAGEGSFVAHAATLDGFVAATNAGTGVALRALDRLTSVVAETRNTGYPVIVTRREEIIIQGGTFFPIPLPLTSRAPVSAAACSASAG